MQSTPRRAITLVVCLATVLLATVMYGRAPEDSVFVYSLFAGDTSCSVIEQRLAALPLRETAILSVEDGGRFVLDSADGAEQLICAMSALKRQHRRVKLLLLQDPVFLGNDVESSRRVQAVAEFARRNRGVEAAVVDLEPYTQAGWTKGSQLDRRTIAVRFTQVLRQLKKAARPLRLEAAVPWWLTSTRDVPEIGLKPLFSSVDGVYLMLYGLAERGSFSLPQRVAHRLPLKDPMLKRGRVYLTLNTEDEPSREQLERDIAELRLRYGGARGFAGISVFHAQGAYGPAAGGK
jgi:hypothetical protein